MALVRVALANIEYPTSPDDSVARATRAIADASAAGAQIICFPECYVPGYRTTDRSVRALRSVGDGGPPPDATCLEQAWLRVANAAREANIAVVLGTERIVNNQPMITALVINRDGTVAGFQDKGQLDPSEDSIYIAGDGRRHVFQDGALTFGVSICHEGWRYPETVRWPAMHGAQIVFHPHFHWAERDSFRPETFVDPRNTFHEKAALARAAENTIFFATVNYATDGSPTTSAFINPDGTVRSYQPYGKAGLLIADLDLDDATRLLASRCRAY